MAGRHIDWSDETGRKMEFQPLSDQDLQTLETAVSATPMLEAKVNTVDVIRLIIEVKLARKRILNMQAGMDNLTELLRKVASLVEDFT